MMIMSLIGLVNRKKARRTNPRKIWPLGQKPGVDFQGGGQNPTYLLHLLFMEVILFKIVKSVDITRRCSACYNICFGRKPGVSYPPKDNLGLLSPCTKKLKNLYHTFDDGSKYLEDFLPDIGHCVILM